jgi:tRNA G18 (ribose-2'-O)-methylase SpoU
MLKKTMDELQRLSADEFKAAEKTPVVVILENIRSMHNVGSVFRTCDGFRIEKLLLCGFTPKPPHRDIHKTALGATESVNWASYENTTDAIDELKKMGYTLYAVEQAHNSILLHDIDMSHNRKIAVIFGNEAEGVTNESIAASDACIEIPQAGSKHSFNISVAAGIVLWELFKRTKLK